MSSDLSRVVVVGTSGAGKTTFARTLAEILGVPHIELDALHWGANWSIRADFVERAAQAAAQPCWVVDGNYRAVSEHVWPRATAFVWLNYSFAHTFGRALRRTARRLWSRERLWAGNRESLARALFDREGVLWWVIRTHARRRREYRALFMQPEYAQRGVLEFAAPRAAEEFLRALRANAGTRARAIG
jgi:adenylate kinase family enzyme